MSAISCMNRVLGVVAAGFLASSASGQASTCNPAGPTITVSPAATTFAVGQKPRINVDFGTSTIEGGTQAEISTLRVSLDCANGTNPCSTCNDEGQVIKYSGDASIIFNPCGGIDVSDVTSNVPAGGAATNVIIFTFSPPIVLPPNQTCNLSFEVEVLAVGGDGSPKTINGFAAFEGECDNAAQFLNGCGTYSYPITNPGIRIVKNVSDGTICQGESVTYTYAVSIPSPFNTRLCDIVVIDDNATPSDDGDDFNPTYLNGDTNGNTCLDVGETWNYSHGPVQMNTAGTFTNIAEVSGSFANAAGTITKTDDDDATVSVLPVPVVQIFGEKICNSEGTGQVCAMITSGRAPYTVCWYQDGKLIPDSCEVVLVEGGQSCLVVDDEGVYCAVATDSNGCGSGGPEDDCGSIDINPNPLVNITPDKICAGSCGNLTATVGGGTAPYSVQWYDDKNNPVSDPCVGVGENGQCVLNVCNGATYTAKVIDSKQCAGEASDALDINPLPSCFINSSADKICPGQTATMCAIASGGTPPYTYLWSTGATTQCLIDIGVAGPYSVTVTDSKGCQTVCNFTLIAHDVDIEIVCSPKGEMIELCADVLSGRPPMVYRWSTSETTQCILVNPAAPCSTFVVTATDSNNCTDTDLFDLILGPNDLCECPGSLGSCPADLDNDKVVGVSDLLIMLNAWGPCPAPPTDCPADLAPQPVPDGVVGAADLLRVINSWGPCG